MKEKVLKIAELELWHPSQFKSMDRAKAIELFMGVATVPDDWNRVYFISEEDFQIALHCVNASIEAARVIEKAMADDVPKQAPNSFTVSF